MISIIISLCAHLRIVMTKHTTDKWSCCITISWFFFPMSSYYYSVFFISLLIFALNIVKFQLASLFLWHFHDLLFECLLFEGQLLSLAAMVRTDNRKKHVILDQEWVWPHPDAGFQLNSRLLESVDYLTLSVTVDQSLLYSFSTLQ